MPDGYSPLGVSLTVFFLRVRLPQIVFLSTGKIFDAPKKIGRPA
jgi:hypothetical protein